MGIERFFSSIERNKITNVEGKISNKLESRVKIESIGIDFNSIVHISSQKVLSELNYLLFKIISNNLEDKQAITIIKKYEIRKNLLGNALQFRKEMMEEIEDIILTETENMFLEIFELLVDNKEIKEIYVAVDGVGSKAKMIEQKKRRYLGTIIEGIKNKLFTKYEDELKKHEKRYIFEKNKLTWSKNNISPGTKFMLELERQFTDYQMENTLKELCPNLQDYYFSGPSQPGEGEKKIVNYYRKTLNYEKYAIYSPDSDVTLLAILMFTPTMSTIIKEKGMHDLIVIRHNQQKDHYDVINIPKLANNFVLFIKNKVSFELDEGRALEDLVFIFSIFGNDFLPKLESFDVKNDFELIINKYIDFINISNEHKLDPYLISFDNGKRSLQYKSFRVLLKVFKQNEGGQMNKNYLANNFRNYDNLKKIMNAGDDFIEKMSIFLEKLRNFTTEIRNSNLQTIMINWQNDIDFIKCLEKFVKLENQTTQTTIIKSIFEYYQEHNRLPKIVIFQRYHRNFDNYHQAKLEAKMDFFGKNEKLLNYDKEIYQMENMLDDYSRKFNAIPSELGKLEIDYKTFTWKADKVIDGVEDYYRKYFKISDINDKKLNDVTKQYIKGLIWVFNYYYNWYDENQNSLSALTWYYPYSKAPLVTQLHETLKEQIDENVFNELSSIEYVERNKFFNTLEALMYVSPLKNSTYLIPNEYIEFVNSSGYYKDLEPLMDEIMNEKTQDEINCEGSIFLNKCELKLVYGKNDLTDIEFIDTLRKIKLTSETNKLVGNMTGDHYVHHYDYRKGISLRKVLNHRNNLSGGDNDDYSNELINLVQEKITKYGLLYSHTQSKKFKNKESLYKKVMKLMK